jgi:cytoskeletal protein RodZ
MDASERLRTAREQAGLTLDTVAARTKISREMLGALERGDVSRLPGGFYARAFVRTYAREVGLPPDELADAFAREHAPAPAPAVRVQDLPPVRGIGAFEPPRPPFWQILPIAALVVVAVVAINRPWQGSHPADPAEAVGTAGSETPAVARAALGAAPASPAPAVEGLVLEIRPTSPVWVTATADGNRAIFRLLQPGDREVVRARQEIALRVGDAGALTYTINGAEGRAFGDPGEVRDVRITRANYHAFER